MPKSGKPKSKTPRRRHPDPKTFIVVRPPRRQLDPWTDLWSFSEAIESRCLAVDDKTFFRAIKKFGSKVFRLKPFREFEGDRRRQVLFDLPGSEKAKNWYFRLGRAFNPRPRGQPSLLPDTILYEYYVVKANFEHIQEKLKSLQVANPRASKLRLLQLLREAYKAGELPLQVKDALEDPLERFTKDDVQNLIETAPFDLAYDELVYRYYGIKSDSEDSELQEAGGIPALQSWLDADFVRQFSTLIGLLQTNQSQAAINGLNQEEQFYRVKETIKGRIQDLRATSKGRDSPKGE